MISENYHPSHLNTTISEDFASAFSNAMVNLREKISQGLQAQDVLEQLMGLLKADAGALILWSVNSALDNSKVICLGDPILSIETILDVERSGLDEVIGKGGFQLIHQGSKWAQKITPFMDDNQFSQVVFFPYEAGKGISGHLLLATRMDKLDWRNATLVATQELIRFLDEMNRLKETGFEAQRRLLELEKFINSSLELTSNLNLSEVLNAILKNALQILPQSNDAHIFLYDGQRLTFGTALYANGSVGKIWAIPRENGLTYTVARTAKMIFVADMRTHPLYTNIPNSWDGSIVGIPLCYKDHVVGVMTVASLEKHQFAQDDLHTLSLLADQAAIAIQNAHLHELIKSQALTDPLTALNNRRSFELEIARQMEISERYNIHLALMMLDLDHFKTVNDTYGHPSGDEALRQISQCLRSNIRKGDFLARIGGDEFAILLPNTGYEAADRVGKQIRECVGHNDILLPQGDIFHITVSYGFAVFPDNALTIEDLIEKADRSLYHFKGN